MSFSSEVVEELIGLELSKTCCRKAMLFGLFMGASLEGVKTVTAEFRNAEIAESAVEILKKQFSAEAELSAVEEEMMGEAATDYLRVAALDARKNEIEERLLEIYEEI